MLVLLHKKTNKVIAHCFPPLSLSTKEAQPDDLEETLNNVVCYYLLISFSLEWIGLNWYSTRFELRWGSYSNVLMCYSYLILTKFDWHFKVMIFTCRSGSRNKLVFYTLYSSLGPRTLSDFGHNRETQQIH